MPTLVSDLAEAAVPMFDVSRRDIMDQARFPHIFRARAAVCLAASISGRSYRSIAKALGGRDGKTIYHACARAEYFAARDPEYRAACEQLIAIGRAWVMAQTHDLFTVSVARPAANDNASAAA